jgi:hypothetical protein
MTAWCYCRNGQQHGPIAFDELKNMIQRGELTDTCHVWKIGASQWLRVGQHPDLISLVPAAPLQAAANSGILGSFIRVIPDMIRRARAPDR